MIQGHQVYPSKFSQAIRGRRNLLLLTDYLQAGAIHIPRQEVERIEGETAP
jgi:hypothetical protein